MEWQVFLTISAVASFVALVGKPIYNNAKNTATMVTELKLFNENFKEYKKNSEAEHKKMWEGINENKEAISDHEKRIWHIEHGKED